MHKWYRDDLFQECMALECVRLSVHVQVNCMVHHIAQMQDVAALSLPSHRGCRPYPDRSFPKHQIQVSEDLMEQYLRYINEQL